MQPLDSIFYSQTKKGSKKGTSKTQTQQTKFKVCVFWNTELWEDGFHGEFKWKFGCLDLERICQIYMCQKYHLV